MPIDLEDKAIADNLKESLKAAAEIAKVLADLNLDPKLSIAACMLTASAAFSRLGLNAVEFELFAVSMLDVFKQLHEMQDEEFSIEPLVNALREVKLKGTWLN